MSAQPPSAEALNRFTATIIGCAMKVHRWSGSGMLESAYAPCLAYELRQAGLRFDAEKEIPLVYNGVRIDRAYIADFVVENVVIVEVKALASVPEYCHRQLLTYLKLTDCRVGLLLNFGAARLKDGIVRIVNNFPE